MSSCLGYLHTLGYYQLVGDLHTLHEGYFWSRRYGFILCSSFYNSCLECYSFTVTTSNFFFSYFTGVTSANMLIFILPSSLYLKITSQDGDKGTQRIWVCLMPATLSFLISFSFKFTKLIVHLHHLILLLVTSKGDTSPIVFPFGRFKISHQNLLCSLKMCYSYCALAFALS